jgi:hemoglobin
MVAHSLKIERLLTSMNHLCGLNSVNYQLSTTFASMKPDVTTRMQLMHLLADFYSQALHDELIGAFFTEVVPLDMEKHLPMIADFWEAVALGTSSYGKNVMAVHQHIHQLSAIKKEHLDRWVLLFTQTIDRHFEGANATLMAQRARSIATLMDLKLNHGGMGKKAECY